MYAAGTLQLAAAVTISAEGGQPLTQQEMQAKMAALQLVSLVARWPPLPGWLECLQAVPCLCCVSVCLQEREGKLGLLLRDRLALYTSMGKERFEQVRLSAGSAGSCPVQCRTGPQLGCC